MNPDSRLDLAAAYVAMRLAQAGLHERFSAAQIGAATYAWFERDREAVAAATPEAVSAVRHALTVVDSDGDPHVITSWRGAYTAISFGGLEELAESQRAAGAWLKSLPLDSPSRPGFTDWLCVTCRQLYPEASYEPDACPAGHPLQRYSQMPASEIEDPELAAFVEELRHGA